jgi:hypothetical protein
MPTKKLTDLFVERVKLPAQGRVEYFDASFPGLALRVTDTGHKSWCAFYRFGGRLRRFTIGRYPPIRPAQARREAQAALERVRDGRHVRSKICPSRSISPALTTISLSCVVASGSPRPKTTNSRAPARRKWTSGSRRTRLSIRIAQPFGVYQIGEV